MKKSKTIRIGIVVGEFHPEISEKLLACAHDEAEQRGALIEKILHVPGMYESPLAAKSLLKDPVIDAVVVLGFIEKGETLNGEVMGHVVNKALIDLSVVYEKPLGMGIVGPGATLAQAEKRVDHAARGGIAAAVALRGTLLF